MKIIKIDYEDMPYAIYFHDKNDRNLLTFEDLVKLNKLTNKLIMEKRREDFHNELSRIGVEAWDGKEPSKLLATKMCYIVDDVYDKYKRLLKNI